MDVSIIIVNYKTSGLIANCINSIIKETQGIDYEIFVVDNNSEENFSEIIEKQLCQPLDIHFIKLEENVGFGRANNAALKYCKARNIFFLNPDTLLLNNAIKILSDFLDSRPEAGACGGNLFDSSLNPTLSFKRELPNLSWEIDELFRNYPHKALYRKNRVYNNSGKPIKVGYITGADLMVKSKVLEETGGFNPKFFMYYEESDLCARIKRKGWKIYSVPDAKIQHLVGQSFNSDKINEKKLEIIEKSRNIYYDLNHTKFNKAICNSIYKLFLKSRKNLSKNKTKKEIYRLRIKYFKESRQSS